MFVSGNAGNNDSHDLNECTSIPEDYGAVIESSQNVSDTSLVLLCIDCLISTFVLITST